MGSKTFCIIFFWGLVASAQIFAQESLPKNQNIEKIRGTRFIPAPNYTGKPYLNDKFVYGSIELADGTIIDHIALNYSTYRDELIYYNTKISAQVQIDKISLNGFSFVDKSGEKRIFRRQFCTASLRSECYFEVLSEGTISLLAYRKVNLETCSTYYSKSGLAYEPAYVYFFYSKEKGYSPVNLNRNSFLSKFDKADQKLVKKMLRKNGTFISDETTLVDAWNLVKESSLSIKF